MLKFNELERMGACRLYVSEGELLNIAPFTKDASHESQMRQRVALNQSNSYTGEDGAALNTASRSSTLRNTPKYINLLNFFLKKALCHFRLTREKDLVLNPAMISTNSRSERGLCQHIAQRVTRRLKK